MPLENSQLPNNEDRIAGQLRLLNQASDGHLDGLECPCCHHPAVSVWFTHPASETYRTWFICGNCDFYFRAQNSTKPRFFGEDRVNCDLETDDALILNRAVFKKPQDLDHS